MFGGHLLDLLDGFQGADAIGRVTKELRAVGAAKLHALDCKTLKSFCLKLKIIAESDSVKGGKADYYRLLVSHLLPPNDEDDEDENESSDDEASGDGSHASSKPAERKANAVARPGGAGASTDDDIRLLLGKISSRLDNVSSRLGKIETAGAGIRGGKASAPVNHGGRVSNSSRDELLDGIQRKFMSSVNSLPVSGVEDGKDQFGLFSALGDLQEDSSEPARVFRRAQKKKKRKKKLRSKPTRAVFGVPCHEHSPDGDGAVVYPDMMEKISARYQSTRAYVESKRFKHYSLQREAVTLATVLDLCAAGEGADVQEVVARRLIAVLSAEKAKGKWTLARHMESSMTTSLDMVPAGMTKKALGRQKVLRQAFGKQANSSSDDE